MITLHKTMAYKIKDTYHVGEKKRFHVLKRFEPKQNIFETLDYSSKVFRGCVNQVFPVNCCAKVIQQKEKILDSVRICNI